MALPSWFTDQLTIENIFLFAVVAEMLLRRIAPLTKWSGDDKLLALITGGKELIRYHGPNIAAIVQDLAATGVVPKAKKADEYWERIEAAWNAAYPGQPMPEPVRNEARLVEKATRAMFPHDSPAPIMLDSVAVPAPLDPPIAPPSV